LTVLPDDGGADRGIQALAAEYGPMAFVEITFAKMSPHTMLATVDGEAVRITVSPGVKATTLAVLDEAIGMAVAEALGPEEIA
jgi:hypothetical protein